MRYWSSSGILIQCLGRQFSIWVSSLSILSLRNLIYWPYSQQCSWFSWGSILQELSWLHKCRFHRCFFMSSYSSSFLASLSFSSLSSSAFLSSEAWVVAAALITTASYSSLLSSSSSPLSSSLALSFFTLNWAGGSLFARDCYSYIFQCGSLLASSCGYSGWYDCLLDPHDWGDSCFLSKCGNSNLFAGETTTFSGIVPSCFFSWMMLTSSSLLSSSSSHTSSYSFSSTSFERGNFFLGSSWVLPTFTRFTMMVACECGAHGRRLAQMSPEELKGHWWLLKILEHACLATSSSLRLRQKNGDAF